jgi:orotate phosphoribosyltransferase
MFAKLKTRAKPSRGVLAKGQNVVVVEDLISTGNSSLLAVEALRCRCKYKGMAAIFTYGFDVAEQNFKNANIDLYTLSNYQNLLGCCQKLHY